MTGTARTTAMSCTRCGHGLKAGATFCSECGALVDVTEGGGARTARSGFRRASIGPALRIAALIAVLGFALLAALYAVWVELSWYAIGEPLGGGVANGALQTWLLSHGGLEGVGVTLTAACWLWLITRIAVAIDAKLFGPAGDDVEGAVALGAAVVYTMVMVILSIAWYSREAVTPRNGSATEVAVASGWGTTLNSVIVLLVVFAAALQGLRRQRGLRLRDLVPAAHVSTVSARVGIVGTAQLAILTLLASSVVVGIHTIELSSRGVGVSGPKAVAATIVRASDVLFTSGVDVSFGFLISAMAFFRIDLYPLQRLPDPVPPWAWVGLSLIVVAFIVGGYLAAVASRALGGTPGISGLATGLGFVAFAVVASGLASPNVDGLSKTAMLASLGWVIVPTAVAFVGHQVSSRGGR